ncbi:hypothetical protein HYD79_00940 [Mycoplasmopsis bovis]|nr:hypothetical protein [Mycoplasmopsis bovis]QQH43025.1 hypothetical protein HYD79_00940 [Mycoplasmopsis bovis]
MTKALKNLVGTVLLEPIMDVSVIVPLISYDLLGDITRRRVKFNSVN